MTFLLSGPPYEYSPLIIGLFGLIGVAGLFCGPIYARYVIDRFVPLFSVVVGDLFCLTGILISTFTGTFTVAGPILQALFNDFGMTVAQTANRSAIYAIDPKARNRINVSFMLATFIGQLIGTAAGNHIYAEGGWIRSGSASVGFIGVSLLFCFVRGPWESNEIWFGWKGGWTIRKNMKHSADGRTTENVFYEDKEKSRDDVEPGTVSLSGSEKTKDVLQTGDDALQVGEGSNPCSKLMDPKEAIETSH